MSEYQIYSVNGPVVKVVGGKGLAMMDMVYAGDQQLIGEVVGVEGDMTTVQVYEDTAGLAPGQPVTTTGSPMALMLGPGLLGNIFDGIARPLKSLEAISGPFLGRGVNIPALDLSKKWDVEITVKEGDPVKPGTLYAQCQETAAILHRCLTPAGLTGTVTRVVPNGPYTVEDVLVEVTDARGKVTSLKLATRCTIRGARPIAQRLPIHRPLITGQRILDTLFPIGKGGAAAIPGPFGAGKTMTQHQLAKWSDADIIVYLGCGERGNEMTQALEEFSELKDPRTGLPLMNRTILIANTSNMPVAAREASVYTGMTIAEYYRDMGYHRRGLPRLPGLPPGRVLRAGGLCPDPGGQGGLCHRHRCCLPSGRRLLRAGDPEHQALCPLLLGPGPQPGLRPALPLHQLAQLLLGVHRGLQRLVQ